MAIVDQEVLSIICARSRAAIIRRADGKPIRRIIPGHRTVPVGIVSSLKVGLPIAYESPAEFLAIKVLESDVSVIGYMAQPHLLRMDDGARHLDFYPDIECVHVDNSIRVIEVKGSSDKRWLDPAYRRKLAMAGEVYRSIGYAFDIVHEADLRASRVYRAATIMWPSRRVVIPDRMVFGAVQAAESGRSNRRTIIDLLGGGPLGAARLDALAIRRLVTWSDVWGRSPAAVCRRVTTLESWNGWA
ncbi:hypothetical protein D3218_07715 [Aureimonas flava]|uniref:TnsA endonuclease N-terminal domain-containing protein n=1 Tax=Aureimonas flava TaxID=2320271 RepID=A0A3A1WJD1_9HYPH|nr:hypothetical protein [Aureimonas flava]RIY01250.1 hypothetical protein D3218_07715 [Aureimonas flava]